MITFSKLRKAYFSFPIKNDSLLLKFILKSDYVTKNDKNHIFIFCDNERVKKWKEKIIEKSKLRLSKE